MLLGFRSMQHALLVGRRQAGAKLAGDFEGFVGGQAADAAEQRGKVLAIHVFHGKDVLPLDFRQVVDPADVRVRHLARGADLVAEAGRGLGVVGEGFGQKLESHGLFQREVVGAVDFPHAALAQEGHDAKASGQQGARRKASFTIAGSVAGRGPRGRRRGDGLGGEAFAGGRTAAGWAEAGSLRQRLAALLAPWCGNRHGSILPRRRRRRTGCGIFVAPRSSGVQRNTAPPAFHPIIELCLAI